MVAPKTCPGGQAGVGRGLLFSRLPFGLNASSPSVGVGVGAEGATAASIGDGLDDRAGAAAAAGAGALLLLLVSPLLGAGALWGAEAAAKVC